MVATGGSKCNEIASLRFSRASSFEAPWLAISIRAERGGDNPLLELRLKYDRWRRGVPVNAPGER